MKISIPGALHSTVRTLVEADVCSDDPLLTLVANTEIDPGAPFLPIVIAALSDLKHENRAAFETLRATLKKTGCRVSSLDELISRSSRLQHTERNAQTNILLKLIESADLFYTPGGVAFADIDVEGHRETWAVRSPGFRRWITRPRNFFSVNFTKRLASEAAELPFQVDVHLA